MWPFRKREIREVEQPHIEVPTDVCTEVNQGIGLLNKLLNLKEYDALHQSPFFAAISLISNSIASMHWIVKSYEDIDIPKNFYTYNLFDGMNVGSFMTIKNMISDVIMYGNGFAYIHRDKSGKPTGIEYLPFGQCNIIYNKASRVLLYQAPEITKSLIEPINILHFKMLANDGIEGRSILSFACNTVKLNASAEKAATDFFGGGMTVKGILSTESPRLTKEQRESIRSAWSESQLGSGNGMAVLESGMKYQQISSNSKDGELLESRLYNVQEVARWFNISPVLLGDLSKSSYNTLEQSQLQFILNTLSPYVSMIEEELNTKLILPQHKNKYYIDVCEEDIVKSDKQSQVNYLSTLVDKGIITRNEARHELGFGPVEGGDELTIAYSDPNQNKINGNNEDKNTQENEDEEQ